MFTLENTLLGYIADGLKWCGDADTSGEDLGHLASSRDLWGERALSSARDPERAMQKEEPQVPATCALQDNSR